MYILGRQSHIVPAGTTGIYRVRTFVDTETLAFRTSLNTRRTRAVSVVPRYIPNSDHLMDKGPVQNYTQTFPPLTPVILSASLHF